MGLVRRGAGPSFPYAGSPLSVLTGDLPFACAELLVPAGFRGPIPHVDDTFDEAIYVIEGTIMAGAGWDPAAEAPAGSMLSATRGTRHCFSNPFDAPARMLGMWSPGTIGLDFMRAIGATLPASGPPDPDVMRELYEAHGSRLQP
jgi:mannose-6-phosphate isomerase-like protein (cupin superfamily)